jgi:hypothetical protein
MVLVQIILVIVQLPPQLLVANVLLAVITLQGIMAVLQIAVKILIVNAVVLSVKM